MYTGTLIFEQIIQNKNILVIRIHDLIYQTNLV